MIPTTYLLGTADEVFESEVANCFSDLSSEIVGAEVCKANVVDWTRAMHSKTESEGKTRMCKSAAEQVGPEGKHDIVGSEGKHSIVGIIGQA